jgi:putative membrane protein
MLINFGRVLMLCVWAFLLLNLFQPFPKPLNIFVNVALIFMILMHGLQLTLLKATQPKDAPPLSRFEQIRIFSSACSNWWPGRKSSRPRCVRSNPVGSRFWRKRDKP